MEFFHEQIIRELGPLDDAEHLDSLDQLCSDTDICRACFHHPEKFTDTSNAQEAWLLCEDAVELSNMVGPDTASDYQAIAVLDDGRFVWRSPLSQLMTIATPLEQAMSEVAEEIDWLKSELENLKSELEDAA